MRRLRKPDRDRLSGEEILPDEWSASFSRFRPVTMTHPARDDSALTPASVRDLSTHLERTLEERWRRYRKAFARCGEKFSEDSVHQLRVETRRLLALLDLLDSLIDRDELRLIRRAVKKFFRRFTRLRDTQVQIQFVDKHRRRFPEIGPFAKALARWENRLIRKLDRQIHRAGWKELKQLVAPLREVLAPSLAATARRIHGQNLVTKHASKAFHRVVALRRRIRPDRPLTIHRTRVAFKRFRYLLELLQPLLPGVSLRGLQEMHDYQTLMGEIQDLEVLQEALDRFAKGDPDTLQKLTRFRQEIERQHVARIAHYLKAADQLLRFWPVKPPWSRRLRPVR
jgi:CHAD domain-containing protein